MGAKQLLFGFSGRINRAKYWGGSLLLAVALIVVLAVLIGIGIYDADKDHLALTIVLVIVGIAAFVAVLIGQTAIGVKRLHDRGKTGWWLFLYYYVPAALQQPNAWKHPDLAGRGIAIAFAAVALGIMIWSLIDLGCLRGTAGPNAYGPDPLDRSEASPPPQSRP